MQPIYFVIPKSHQDAWPQSVKRVVSGYGSINDIANDLRCGIDVWILQTWLILSGVSKKHSSSFQFELVEEGVPNALCVFHFDTAKPCHGLFKGYPLVVQADRPKVPFAELCIIQNLSHTQTERLRYIPLWPQPGIIPRNPERGTTIERIAIPGDTQYIPTCIQEEWFRKALEDLGVHIKIMEKGNWIDYSDVDLILAWRPTVLRQVLYTKPPSKLINAWHANTPALLGPEPAYQALRTDQNDYIEVHTSKGIIQHIRYLKENPEMYRCMLEHYKQRAKNYTYKYFIQEWYSIFVHAQYLQEKEPKSRYRHFQYYYQRVCNQLLKHSRFWQD